MKRQAIFRPVEDELEDDEDETAEDDFDADQLAENLSVFCVSALDYRKLKGLMADGTTQVRGEFIMWKSHCL